MNRLAIIAVLLLAACTPLDVVCPVLPFDEGVCVLKEILDDKHPAPAAPPD